MNAPAPGWNPDPTRRHEYRYWDGGAWTDHVSDKGVASVDPVGEPPAAAAGGGAADGPAGEPPAAHPGGSAADDPTAPLEVTRQFGTPPSPPAPDGAPGTPARSGPPAALVVGLVVLAVALIAGIAFAVWGGDDDETVTGDAGSTDTTEDTTADTTAPTGTAPPGDTPGATSGDLFGDLGDEVSTEAIVDAMATGIELQGGGLITREQAVCAAERIVEHYGIEGLADLGSGAEPLESVPPADQSALVTAMTDCIPADVLAEIGMNRAGEGG